ncbi:unnamed protein product, partial [Meganyctiphanes norvegica]
HSNSRRFIIKIMFNSVVNCLFYGTPKEFNLPQLGPVHGPKLPEEDAVRVVLCYDGVLAEDIIPWMYRGNRLTPEPAHAEPPLLYRNFGQQGMSLSDLAKSVGEEFVSYRRMWANFRPRITVLALGGHDLQRQEIVQSPHRSYAKQVKNFFFSILFIF